MHCQMSGARGFEHQAPNQRMRLELERGSGLAPVTALELSSGEPLSNAGEPQAEHGVSSVRRSARNNAAAPNKALRAAARLAPQVPARSGHPTCNTSRHAPHGGRRFRPTCGQRGTRLKQKRLRWSGPRNASAARRRGHTYSPIPVFIVLPPAAVLHVLMFEGRCNTTRYENASLSDWLTACVRSSTT